MFNRVLQVRMIKKATNTEPTTEDQIEDLTEKIVVVTAFTERVIKKIAMAALAYVAVDTARQVVIARAIKH